MITIFWTAIPSMDWDPVEVWLRWWRWCFLLLILYRDRLLSSPHRGARGCRQVSLLDLFLPGLHLLRKVCLMSLSDPVFSTTTHSRGSSVSPSVSTSSFFLLRPRIFKRRSAMTDCCDGQYDRDWRVNIVRTESCAGQPRVTWLHMCVTFQWRRLEEKGREGNKETDSVTRDYGSVTPIRRMENSS